MSEIPNVTLAGKSYSVPPLVTRQLREVVPAIVRLGALVNDPAKLTTALYDDMIKVLFWGAVWPNDKKADVACLMDVHIPLLEVQAAMKVIRDQTGLFVDAPKEGAQQGEAPNP